MLETNFRSFRRVASLTGLSLALAACDMSDFGRGPGPGTTSDERVAQFQSQLARNPDSVKALVGIGSEYSRQADWPRASGAYREALLVEASNRPAQLGYSVAQSALGEYQSALNHANRALASKSDTDALIAAAVALNGQRRHSEAKDVLDTALATNPRDLDVRNNLALTLALMGDSKAYSLQRAVAFAPDANFRHHRNFYMIAAMLGLEGNARRDGGALNLTEAEIDAVTKIGRRARAEGMAAFGLTARS